MAQPDPNLLSLLEKITNPLKKIHLNLQIKGLFAPPESWKTTDQLNPNIFTYQMQLLSITKKDGKIIPRQLTEKQMKEAQESKKKVGKKDSKIQQQRKSPEEEQQQRRLQQQWDALSPQQQRYKKLQDPFKSFSLQFDQKITQLDLQEQNLQILQSNANQGYCQVQFIRKCTISQQEIAKLKKSKPKNLNVQQLTPIYFKGKMPLQKLNEPGQTETQSRIQLIQNLQKCSQACPKFNIEGYLYICIQIDNPLMPKVLEITPSIHQLIPHQPLPTRKKTSDLIQQLKGEIVIAIKTINSDYTAQYQKESQFQQQKKSIAVFANMKNIEINKKKDQFLTEFVSTGKFKLLKQRFRKPLMQILIDKFEKVSNFLQMTSLQKNKILGEMQVFLNEQIQQVVDQFIQNREEQLHEDILFNHEFIKINKNKQLILLSNESKQQSQLRIASEYQTINLLKEAQNSFKNLILLVPQSDRYHYLYGQFCLRHKLFQKAERLLQKTIELSSIDGTCPYPEINLLLATLLIRRHRKKEAFKIIKQQIAIQESKKRGKKQISGSYRSLQKEFKDKQKDKDKQSKQSRQSKQSGNPFLLLTNQLAHFLFQRQGNKKLALKYKLIVQKLYKKKNGLIIDKNKKVASNPYQLLSYAQKIKRQNEEQTQGPKLTAEQNEELECQLLNFFSQNHFYDLITLPIQNKIIECKVHSFNQDYSAALQVLDSLPKIQENLLLRGQICFIAGIIILLDKMYQCQQVYLEIKVKKFTLYLRLGWVYIHRKAWIDAENMFLKALELKANSSLSWLGLGIACFNLNKLKQSEQAFNQGNIFNPEDQQVLFNLEILKNQNKQLQLQSQYQNI